MQRKRKNLRVMGNEGPTSQKTVGRRLKATRALTDFTQAEFAMLLGIETTAYNNYELGKRPMPTDVAIRICVKIGVDLDWIYRGLRTGLPLHLAQQLEYIAEDAA